jgi:GTP pyrophosphokinase
MIQESVLKEKYGENDAKLILSVAKKLQEKQTFSKRAICDSEETANIVIGLSLDAESVCASLIFPYALENPEIVSEFAENSEIAKILAGLVKLEEYSKDYTDIDGLREMLVAITKDIRVIIIKTAQILVFARKNVTKYENEKVLSVFRAIDDIYAPISARLGLSEIKSELQDLSFEFHEPKEYEKLKDAVKKETRANTHMINEMVSDVKNLLRGNGIECTSYGRIKHLSSIYNKIKNKHYSLKNIYDIAAVRILVNSVSECYMALGIVHSSFVPVDGRFKDYIASPKPNGYQSLHTTIYFKKEFFEVQIRTYQMHDFAEYGVAAHFLYKEHKKNFAGLDGKLLWIRKMLENKDNVSSEKLLEELKTDVYLGEIFVQTPKGKVIKLVENATPIDFAYAIHTDIGNKCTGAKVNGRMVPLTSTLANGDVVEILTSQSSKGPSRDWLKKVKMQSTKDKINYYFKKQMKEENIKLGKSMLEQYAKSNDINLASLMQEKWVNQILKKNAFLSLDEIYASIGYGSLTVDKFVHRLQTLKAEEDKKTKNIFDEVSKVPVKIENNSDIIGAEGTLTKYCKCCNPIPGDDIVGYVSRGRGIIIHRKNCENVANLPKDRFINVDWNLNKNKDYTFTSIVDVVAKNTSNIYLEITNALSELGIKVSSLNTNQNKQGDLILKIGVQIKDKDQLGKVKNKLSSLGSVFEVK